MNAISQNTLVVYYSRSHHSQRLADEIALKLGAYTYEIEADRYALPGLGYLRAGYESVTGKLPPLTKDVPDFRSYAYVVLCGPVWTSYLATPIRAFLTQYRGMLPHEVGLFLTNGDHNPAQTAFDMAQDLLGRSFKVQMSICNRDQATEVLTTQVARFCEALREPTMPHAEALS